MTPCKRKCWTCGNVAMHEDNVTPWVLCKKCGSQDTRLIPEKTAREKRCEAECNRDPIFLLQSRRLQLMDVPYDEDEEHFDFTDGVMTRIKDEDGNDLDEPEDIDIADWVQRDASTSIGDIPCVFETWETESVWLDRTEAETWGKSHEYRFKHGWRVYCVCAEGDLAKLLREQP